MGSNPARSATKYGPDDEFVTLLSTVELRSECRLRFSVTKSNEGFRLTRTQGFLVASYSPIDNQSGKEVRKKMRKYSGIRFVWTLVTFRNGEQGPVRSLEEAEFRFGRTHKEVSEFGIRSLPTGIISLIVHSGLEEEALETGFSLEISRKPILNGGWVSFSKLAGDDSVGPNWENPRSVFASPELEGTFELVNIGNPCSGYNPIPSKVSIRVRPLTMPLIAWAMSNDIFSCPKGDQRTLHDWVELTSKTPENIPKKLALPGPSNWNYTFLN